MPRLLGRLAGRAAAALAATVLVWAAAGLAGDRPLEVEAASLSAILDLAGVSHVRVGRTIYIIRGGEVVGLRIDWHCSGLVSYTIFLAASLLLPMRPWRRLYWLTAGFLVIYLANILRILLVAAAAEKLGVEAAASMHSIAGPLLLLGSVALLLSLEAAEVIRRGGRL